MPCQDLFWADSPKIKKVQCDQSIRDPDLILQKLTFKKQSTVLLKAKVLVLMIVVMYYP